MTLKILSATLLVLLAACARPYTDGAYSPRPTGAGGEGVSVSIGGSMSQSGSRSWSR